MVIFNSYVGLPEGKWMDNPRMKDFGGIFQPCAMCFGQAAYPTSPRDG